MLHTLKTLINYLADDILKLKRYISPIDKSTKLRRKEFLKEQKYLQDFDFMIDTIEECICISPDEETETERQCQLNDDYRYFQLTNKINIYGKNSLLQDEIIFLNKYCNT